MTTEPQGAKNTAIEYTQYCRIAIAEMTDWFFGFDMAGVSVNEVDRNDGSPKVGDKIARNPKNHADKWLVAAAYFADNFKPINAEEMTTPEQKEAEKRVIEAAKRRRAFYHKYNYCADCTHESKCKSCFNEDLLTCKLICDAVDALNALSTPVESLPEKADATERESLVAQLKQLCKDNRELKLPIGWESLSAHDLALFVEDAGRAVEKVDEWDGWEAFAHVHVLCVRAICGEHSFLKTEGDWGESCCNLADVEVGIRDENIARLHGPARLEVLTSLPDDLVKAAKGVGNDRK